MKPYCIQTKDVTSYHKLLHELVTRYVNLMPDNYTCHQVCAEVIKKLNEDPVLVGKLIHYKGYFYQHDHSWLVLADNRRVIIDAYPWACASGPILLTTEGGVANPWYYLYDGRPVT